MINGSSAITSQYTKQIVAPIVKATMRSGEYLNSITTVEQANFGYDAGDGFVFGGVDAIYSVFARTAKKQTLLGTDAGGSIYDVLTRGDSQFVDASHVVVGNTGIFTAIRGGGVSWTVYRLFANFPNYFGWGATEIVLAGTSSRPRLAVTSVDSNNSYIIEAGSTGRTGNIIRIQNSGGWGATTILSNFETSKVGNSSRYAQIYSKKIGDDTFLVYTASDFSKKSTDLETGTEGIKVLHTDSINVFSNDYIIAPVFYDVSLSNIVRGGSLYYFAFNGLIRQSGASQPYQTDYKVALTNVLMKTGNFREFNNGIFLGQSLSSNLSSKNIITANDNIDLPPILFGVSMTGVSSPYSGQRIDFLRRDSASASSYGRIDLGVSRVDVSAYVTDYSNTNNQRINLNLGNFI